jgi:hypothetical protein
VSGEKFIKQSIKINRLKIFILNQIIKLVLNNKTSDEKIKTGPDGIHVIINLKEKK